MIPESPKRPPDGRAALVLAARHLIGERPASTIRGRDIAAFAGVAYGLVSYHWPGGSSQLLVEVFDSLHRAWVAELNSVESWIDNPAAGAFFRVLRLANRDTSFSDAWSRWGSSGDGSLRKFAELRPDLPPAEQLARWALLLRLRADLERHPGDPSVIRQLAGDQPTVAMIRADRIVQAEVRAEMRRLLVG